MKNDFLKIIFLIFYICLSLKILINEKHFLIKKIFDLVFKKNFLFILGEKYFLKVVKKLEISYYLLIISNLVLKLLIALYFIVNLFFSNFIP